ncbi:MAG TPA: hypothetical protein VG939_19745, partial [Caulobacteraceae bacterium]|nr:hypothetical protein [Caulobacteraceae bacterium]
GTLAGRFVGGFARPFYADPNDAVVAAALEENHRQHPFLLDPHHVASPQELRDTLGDIVVSLATQKAAAGVPRWAPLQRWGAFGRPAADTESLGLSTNVVPTGRLGPVRRTAQFRSSPIPQRSSAAGPTPSRPPSTPTEALSTGPVPARLPSRLDAPPAFANSDPVASSTPTGSPEPEPLKIRWGKRELAVQKDGPGYWGVRTIQPNRDVNAFELQINGGRDRSYYLQHPDGKFLQFENYEGGWLQDAKRVRKKKSIYHVEWLPPFAANRTLSQAGRQAEAAEFHGLNVEWLVSEAEAAAQLRRAIDGRGLGVQVRHVPAKGELKP